MLIRPRLCVVLAVVTLLAPGLLRADVQGRVYGTVFDQAGEPIAGITMIVTDPEVAHFRIELETDEEGKYSVTLPDATRPYTYRVQGKSYQPFEASFKIPAGESRAMDFTVLSASLVAPDVFNEGNAAAREGDYALAKEKYRQALALDSGLEPAHAALATVLLLEKNYAEAAEAAGAALALEPTNEKMLTLRYQAYKALGEKEKTAEALAALEAADPKIAATDLFNRGVVAFDAGRMQDAIEALEQALTADPEFAKAHYYLGLCHVNTGNTALAREHLTAFVEMAPEDPDAAAARDMLDYLE
jgi:tetratricopeptide (TPR) repeat protein